MKKLSIALVLTLLLALFTATSVSAATVATETEPNDSTSAADVISAGLIEGKMNTYDDVDYYKFNANQDYFTLTLNISSKNLSADVGDGWNVVMYDSNMTELYSFHTTTTYTSPRFAVSGVIYVKVSCRDTFLDPATGVLYEVKYKNSTNAYWENEYNDLSTSANPMTVGKTYYGSMNHHADQDWFKFTSLDYFTVTLKANTTIPTEYNVQDGWRVTVYDSNKAELTSFTTKTLHTTIQYPMTGTIYVEVKAADNFLDPCTHTYYELTAKTAANALWESEYNDSFTTANVIAQGKAYTGNLHKSSDVDYYKFKSTTPAFAVRFAVKDVEPSAIQDGWKITVYAQDTSRVLTTFTVNAIGTYDSVTLPYQKGLNYYVKIEAKDNFLDPPTEQTYHFAIVDKTAKHTWEVETGNTGVSSATALAEGKAIFGNLYSGKDNDYYKIKVVSPGTIKIKFKRAESDKVGDGYLVRVIDASGKKIVDDTKITDLSAAISKVPVNKGNYYIVILAAGYDAPSAEIDYYFSYAYTPDAPTVSKVTGAKNSFKVTFKKVTSAAKYQLQYSTNKNFKGAKTESLKASATSFTVKKTTAGKVYYVRMRVVVKDGSKNYTSPWSEVSATANNPTIKKVTPTKNSFKVTWDKTSGATSYQVQYATNKNFKSAKTAKSSSTSVTIKDTSASKVYYLRMRVVVKVNGKNFYSSWSETVKVVNTPSLNVKAAKGALKASWTKVTGATGYQIQYSTNKNFSSAKIDKVSSSKTSFTIPTAPNKTYYVRLRVIVDGNPSPWSAAVTVKAK